MRVVMEMQDLLEILGAHLGHEITPEQVRIRTDPHFELEVAGAVTVADMRPRQAPSAAVGADTKAQVREVLSRSLPADAYVEEAGSSMDELLAYSREIESDVRNYKRR